MLAPGNYVQWKSRIKRYIDTKPNSELIHKIHHTRINGLRRQFQLLKVVLKQLQRGIMDENYKNVSQDNENQLKVKRRPFRIISHRIYNDINSIIELRRPGRTDDLDQERSCNSFMT
ncbi:hypothetical protein Tco_0627807 [Tanacetum coccineum]|uniref:Uncharacterized protein n=1 Tax=Tanacetum coccineum TaxID=301880 RepID=A0ABQ4WNJ9_9ASTR